MKHIYLMIFCLLMAISSCDMLKNKDPKLRVKNVSDKAIYVSWTTDYPDTSLNHMVNPTYNPKIEKVEAYSVQKEYYQAPSEGLFSDNVDTLSVFIFDAKVLESTPWDTVKVNYLVLKRYDLSLADLIGLNWMVTYP